MQPSARTEALIRQTYELFEHYIELAPKMTPDILLSVLSSEDPGYIADYIAQNLPMRTGDKQAILEELRPVRRLEQLCQILRREVEILELEQEMQDKVREQLTRSQRDYVLREQLKVHPAGAGGGRRRGDSELDEYRRQIAEAKLPARCGKSWRRRCAGWRSSPSAPPRPPSSAAIWTRCWSCPGARRPRSGWTWRPPARCWTPTTTAWTR